MLLRRLAGRQADFAGVGLVSKGLAGEVAPEVVGEAGYHPVAGGGRGPRDVRADAHPRMVIQRVPGGQRFGVDPRTVRKWLALAELAGLVTVERSDPIR